VTRTWLQFDAPSRLILAAIAFLFLVGLASIYVTDTAAIGGHDGPRNATRQLVYLCVGISAAMVVLRIGYRDLGRWSYAILALALLALIPLMMAKLTHSTFGGLIPERRHAYRWINLGLIDVQPSEFMKVAFIVALAWYLRFRRNYRRFGGLIRPLLAAAVPLALILRQPDLGTCTLLLPVLLIMLFMAGAQIRHLAVLVAIGLVTLPLTWTQMRNYQRSRIVAVLLQSDALRRAIVESPQRYSFLTDRRSAVEWKADSGYQLVASKTAIGSGGLAGFGWGRGPYVEHAFLPDRHNDLIFAVIAHQWGLVGAGAVLIAYACIAVGGAAIAARTTEPFGRMLAIGITSLLMVQTIINVGMTVGLMPITGMNLPFVSYGGSNLLSNFLAIGLLVSVAQHRPFLLSPKPFEFRQRQRRRSSVLVSAPRSRGHSTARAASITALTNGSMSGGSKRASRISSSINSLIRSLYRSLRWRSTNWG